MTSDRQLSLLPDRGYQLGAALQELESAPGEVGDLVDVGRAQVGHLADLEIASDVLDGIELRRISGKVVEDGAIDLRLDKLAHQMHRINCGVVTSFF